MKQKITLNCNANQLFDYLTSQVIEAYKNKKGKEPTQQQLENHLRFETEVVSGKNLKTALITVKKYKRPTAFTMEYKSDTYHKIEVVEIKPLGENECELIYGKEEQKIKNGKVAAKNGDVSDGIIKNMSFFEGRKFNKVAKYLNEKAIENEEEKAD